MTIIYSSKETRKRDPNDFYPTPDECVQACINTIHLHDKPMIALDMGAGDGVWGRHLPKDYGDYIAGVELRPVPEPPKYDKWYNIDFIRDDSWLDTLYNCNLIIGNPPYKYAEYLVYKIINLWKEWKTPNAKMCFLLRLAFLEGNDRGKYLYRNSKPTKVSILCRRPSFTGNKRSDNTAYAFYEWDSNDIINQSKGLILEPRLEWIEWNYNG